MSVRITSGHRRQATNCAVGGAIGQDERTKEPLVGEGYGKWAPYWTTTSAKNTGKIAILTESGAHSGARSTVPEVVRGAVAILADAWPGLTQDQQDGIMRTLMESV